MVSSLIVALAIASTSTVAPVSKASFLVFSKTTGFRHDAIPDGQKLISALAKEKAWKVDFSEDSSVFQSSNLAQYDVVVFMMTTGDLFDERQKSALKEFIERGGGYVGVHSASDTEYKWEWYGKLVGAWFSGHPAQQEAKIIVENKKHPSTKFLPTIWVRRDEWYNFKTNPRPNVTVLASIDESSYQGGTMNGDHPMIWCHPVGKGRSWYTALGHTHESYTEPLFIRSLTEGMIWAAQNSPRKSTSKSGIFDDGSF